MIHNFLHKCVGGVKNFNYVCSGFLCYICAMISLSSWAFFMVFNLVIGSGFIFEFCS